MSYILDALQRSSQDELADSLPSQTQTTHTGLALPWKIAIGAVLATNLLFLYLWQTGEGDKDRNQQAIRKPIQTELSSRPDQDYYPPQPTAPDTRKKILPGIASPRDLPLPQTSPGTARTFRPTGAPITIADPPTPETPGTQIEPLSDREIAARALAETEPTSAIPSTSEAEPGPNSLPDLQERAEAVTANVSQLYELSDGAREALYVLNFSFHIYSEDADLRAVVVNGKRLSEGSNVIAENGQSFRLLEIFDTGVIMQFDHEGATETVEIPVIEDWKEA